MVGLSGLRSNLALMPRVGGSYHLVEYNATTGGVIDRLTVQGFANNRYELSLYVRVDDKFS
jgi:hypothetical protein